jgi:hypothetical protein
MKLYGDDSQKKQEMLISRRYMLDGFHKKEEILLSGRGICTYVVFC